MKFPVGFCLNKCTVLDCDMGLAVHYPTAYAITCHALGVQLLPETYSRDSDLAHPLQTRHLVAVINTKISLQDQTAQRCVITLHGLCHPLLHSFHLLWLLPCMSTPSLSLFSFFMHFRINLKIKNLR
jgi:hypothetical protein